MLLIHCSSLLTVQPLGISQILKVNKLTQQIVKENRFTGIVVFLVHKNKILKNLKKNKI